MDRRTFMAGAAAAAALLGLRPAAAQETYPARPITVINPFPPGGAADVVTRPLAAAMEAAPQATGRDRHQGGRGRGRSAPNSPHRPSPTAIR